MCAEAWRAAGWNVAVLIDADQPDVSCELLIREENYRGAPAAYNRLIEAIGGADLVACVNDDMFPVSCTPRQAEEAMGLAFDGTDGVIQPTGCWMESMKWCAPSPIIGREYLSRGPVWDERFYHLYADQLLRDTAIRAGKFRDVKGLSIEHRHKSLGFADTLPVEKRRKNDERHQADRRLYESLRAVAC